MIADNNINGSSSSSSGGSGGGRYQQSSSYRRLFIISYILLTIFTLLYFVYYSEDIVQLHQRWYGSSSKKTVKTDDADDASTDSLLTDDETFWLGDLDSLNNEHAEIWNASSIITAKDELAPQQQQPLLPSPHPSSFQGATTNSKGDDETSAEDLVAVEESVAELSDATSANNDSDETATEATTAANTSVVKVNYQNNHSNNTITTHHELPTTRSNNNMKHENGTFIGANIWYRYWKMASVGGSSSITSSSSASSSDNNAILDHTHDAYILSQLTTNSNNNTISISTMANEHILQMKARYESVNAIPDYRVRGLGWIEHRLGMILAVIPVVNSDGNDSGNNGDVSIFIVDTVGNMKCGGSSSSSSDKIPPDWMEYHPPLTMWVRANGPEIYTGTALPHIFVTPDNHNNNNKNKNNNDNRHRCAWRYNFRPRISGEYSIYVKVLTFNGFADWTYSKCNAQSLLWELGSDGNVIVKQRDDKRTELPNTDEQCPFCNGGIPTPEMIVPQTGGNNCSSIKLLAVKEYKGTDTCKIIQEKESVCCSTNTTASNTTTTTEDDNRKMMNLTNSEIQAAIVQELATQGNFSHHRGLMAFKNYDKIPTCCEACTRARGCKMWSMPGEIDECELYFDRVEDDLDFWDDDKNKYLGRDRTYSYVGQSKSDFPIVRTRRRSLAARSDDEMKSNDVFRRKLAVQRNHVNLLWKWPSPQIPDTYGQPRNEPVSDFIGCGWSCLKSFESPCHYPSDDLIFGSGKRINISVGTADEEEMDKLSTNNITEYDGSKRACSLVDESFGTKGRWVKYPFPDDSVCGPIERDYANGGALNYMPKYNGTKMPPHCWHRDNIDQCCNLCAEQGCKFIVDHRWVSDLRRAGKWFGMWEHVDCYYNDLSSADIQQCINRRNISSIELKGASVSEILKRYILQKLNGVKMVESTPDSLDIVLDTLKMPHVIWHKSLEEFRNELNTTYEDVNDIRNRENYFVTGYYYSSEREPHVSADRSLQFSHLAAKTLLPKGYRMINAFDVTSAFTFDTDAQNDGLHINGPPNRAIITKFFHHLCDPTNDRNEHNKSMEATDED